MKLSSFNHAEDSHFFAQCAGVAQQSGYHRRHWLSLSLFITISSSLIQASALSNIPLHYHALTDSSHSSKYLMVKHDTYFIRYFDISNTKYTLHDGVEPLFSKFDIHMYNCSLTVSAKQIWPRYANIITHYRKSKSGFIDTFSRWQ